MCGANTDKKFDKVIEYLWEGSQREGEGGRERHADGERQRRQKRGKIGRDGDTAVRKERNKGTYRDSDKERCINTIIGMWTKNETVGNRDSKKGRLRQKQRKFKGSQKNR